MTYARCRNLVFITMVAAILGLLTLHPTASVRAQAAWEVLFNDTPSGLALVETETGKMVPVHFAVPADGQRQHYAVWIESDPTTMKVKVTRVKTERPVRGPGKCRFCNGSKDCQDCYPAGSKVNTGGLPCIGCNATGKCNFCHGSGVCYTCDGRGFDTGCPDCGKYVAKN